MTQRGNHLPELFGVGGAVVESQYSADTTHMVDLALGGPSKAKERGVPIKRSGVPRVGIRKGILQARVCRLVVERTRRILSRVRTPFGTQSSNARGETQDLKNVTSRALSLIVGCRPQRP
jgi:hypothetical protein